jgi:nitroreductase
MDTLAAIQKRRSIRKYLEKPISLDVIGAIVESGMMAPNAGNHQAWRFIVVRDLEKRKSLAKASLEQYWMSKAPVHIVIVSEEAQMEKLYGVRGEKLYGIQTCAAAIENILLSATDFGLGSCWIGAFDEVSVSRICGIPPTARAQAIITLGYADEKPDRKVMQPLKRLLFLESYGGRISEISDFMWDWSDIIQKEVNATKSGVKSVLKKVLDSHKKNFEDKLKKINKKVDSKIQRPL